MVGSSSYRLTTQQVDGAPMGGCVSPTLAEVFMGHYGTIWLENCPLEFKTVLYKRYVDDSFVLFKSGSHIELFLDYLNSQLSSIKFTHETERNGCLPFLDVHVKKTETGFDTILYRKHTFNGLITKYKSAVGNRNKIILVQCLCERSYKICSSVSSL